MYVVVSLSGFSDLFLQIVVTYCGAIVFLTAKIAVLAPLVRFSEMNLDEKKSIDLASVLQLLILLHLSQNTRAHKTGHYIFRSKI